MSEWEPATDAEAAMRDALRTDDQESYFRILAGIDLLLPVSADALAGLAPLGWGTWSTGGRTHVLAFTSPAALQACLADYTGSARRVAYGELADTWPNLEWWLAVNPGLPIEGYLPAWFVAQLSRGDLRLPKRGPARESLKTTQNPEEMQAAALAANAAATGQSGGPMPPEGRQPSGERVPAGPVSPAGYGRDRTPGGPGTGGPGTGGPGTDRPGSGGPGTSGSGAGAYGAGGPGTTGGSTAVRPGHTAAPAAAEAGAPASGQVGPGGLPIRTPGAVLPSGLPSRVPASSLPGDPSGAGYGGFSGFAAGAGGEPGAPEPGRPGVPGGGPTGYAGPGGAGAPRTEGATGVPAAYQPPTVPPASGASQPGPAAPAGATRATPPQQQQDPRGPLPTRTPMAQTPPLPSHLAGEGVRPETEEGTPAPAGAQMHAGATRADPADYRDKPDRDRPTGDRVAGDRDGGDQAGGDEAGGGLPRRQVTPPTERPASMAAAAQALAGSRTPPAETAPPAGRPGLAPPVIPGAGGSERPPFVPAASVRPEIPTVPSSPAPTAPPAPGRDDDEPEFVPANAVERDLLDAADGGSTDAFLSTLLLATVLVPVADSSRPGSSPGESGFAFRTEEVDGERFLVVFTSRDRLAEHYAEPTRTVGVKFLDLIRNWPDPAWSFAVNPSTPVGAKYPGAQVIALANWAAEAGLGADQEDRDDKPAPLPQRVSEAAQHATIMQKTVPAEQVDYYLERGYDRVAGFVHRANEVEHLHTPAELFSALGLVHDGTPYTADAKEAFVLRWPAYRPSLYRIPYGGQSEQALRAMDGWVIERPPFRGNGFAPGEGRDVIAEFKVDSVRLPHGAELWRMDADGTERMIAIFDCDGPIWRKVGEQ